MCYGDDILLFAKTKRSAQRTQEHILPFIENRLLLKVDGEKTAVAYIGRVKSPGYDLLELKLKQFITGANLPT